MSWEELTKTAEPTGKIAVEPSLSDYHFCGVSLHHFGERAVFHQTLTINSQDAGGAFLWEPNLPLASSTNRRNLKDMRKSAKNRFIYWLSACLALPGAVPSQITEPKSQF